MQQSMRDMQRNIRRNADELSEFVNDLGDWQHQMQKTPTPAPEPSPPIEQLRSIRGQTIVQTNAISTTASPHPLASKISRADSHTYDKGYSKWESFDVEGALKDLDEEKEKSGKVSAATPITETKPAEVAELPDSKLKKAQEYRQKGNNLFSSGDYEGAIRFYTLCLEEDGNHVAALTNRAQAYLSLKKFSLAESDCTKALYLESGNMKALLRRGTARLQLRKYRSSVLDFEDVISRSENAGLVKIAKQRLSQTKKLLQNDLQAQRAKNIVKLHRDENEGQQPQRRRIQVEVVSDSDTESEPEGEHPEADRSREETQPVATVKTVEKPAEADPDRRSNDSERSPVALPTNCYDFERIYRRLKPDPARLYEFLKRLSRERFTACLGQLLDGEMLECLLSSVATNFSRADPDTTIRILQALADASRFEITLMFLEEHTTDQLERLFADLSVSTADTVAHDDVLALAQNYNVNL